MRYPAQLPDMAPPAEAGDGPPGWGRQRRRRAAVIAVVIAVVLVAGSVWWAVAAPGTYGRSHAGCVTASVPSTTGGGLVHACGDKAKSLCRASFTRTDRLSRALRPQCRAAGLGPAAGSAPTGSGLAKHRLRGPWISRGEAGQALVAQIVDRPRAAQAWPRRPAPRSR